MANLHVFLLQQSLFLPLCTPWLTRLTKYRGARVPMAAAKSGRRSTCIHSGCSMSRQRPQVMANGAQL